MLNTLKWVYDLGKQHERRRIEMAIKGYRAQQPPYFIEDEREKAEYDNRQRAIESEIHNLINPHRTEIVERSVIDE